MLSLLLDNVTGLGLEGREVPFRDAEFVRFGVEARGWMVDGGVDVAYTEFKVEDERVSGTVLLVPLVPLDPFVPSGDALLFDLKLVVRLRKSLKKGIEGHLFKYGLELFLLVLHD